MRPRHLDVTARTTLDLVDARAVGAGWRDDAVAVLDVESTRDEAGVSLQLELDPGECDHVDHHADVVSLSPAQARTLAAALDSAAAAAETDEAMESGRVR